MRPTLDYIIEKFDYYNQLCFDGKLKRPPILLNTRYSAMGQTGGVGEIDENGKIHWSELRIEISVRRDLPEYEYIDTLVHEMIHYYIMSNDMEDDSPHGRLFRQKMEEITNKHGIRITIQYDPSEDDQDCHQEQGIVIFVSQKLLTAIPTLRLLPETSCSSFGN